MPIYKVSKDRWKWRKKTEVSHPILKREEEEQPDSSLWINGKLGNPPIQEVRRERPEREVRVRTQRFGGVHGGRTSPGTGRGLSGRTEPGQS